ncbi:MAG: NAD(+) synthase, partial [Oscillospiraceae bacterium]
KKRVDHINAKGLVIGISGGLDSCLALLVCCGAMDPEKITAITMPCFGTGDRTKNNACRLCELLGVKCLEIPI